MSQPQLSGAVAIVTGASSGIGAATARELVRRGARVVLAARRLAALETTAAAIAAAGGEALSLPTDVTDRAQVDRLVERTIATYGHVDVLVNNAGVNWLYPLAETSPEDVAHLIEVNLLGPILLTRAVLPGMLERRSGTIIAVGSVAGRVAIEPLYSASKYGLRGFTLALRRQLHGTGVSVSLIAPGNIQTPMTRDRRERMPGPEIVASAIADLVRHPRRELVLPAKYRAIAWLEQLGPGIADYLYHRRHRTGTLSPARLDRQLPERGDSRGWPPSRR